MSAYMKMKPLASSTHADSRVSCTIARLKLGRRQKLQEKEEKKVEKKYFHDHEFAVKEYGP